MTLPHGRRALIPTVQAELHSVEAKTYLRIIMILPAVAGHVRGGGEIPMRAQSLCSPDSFPIDKYIYSFIFIARRGLRQILRIHPGLHCIQLQYRREALTS